jgi:anaerobic selenocysteine-containing dehydrogenase
MAAKKTNDWKSTACILCYANCGVQVELGGTDGRHITRVRGDKAHPGSRGYTCNKALQLDYYQNARDRLTSPLRRKPGGSFEAIDWDTAIAEIAAKLAAIRDAHGGDKIFYYGGGGQGNHMGGLYGTALREALGIKYRSSALAQEKTGLFWLHSRMIGGRLHPDLEHAEVVVIIGKNPWQSNGFQRARVLLRQTSKDPERTLIVIDPRRTESAELADIHLQVKPGTDAWCLAAMIAVIVQEDLVDHDWLAGNAAGHEAAIAHFRDLPVEDYAALCGLSADEIRQAARRIATAESAAGYEDLGVQMAPNSTLCSYLDLALFLLTGNFGKQGGMVIPTSFVPLYAIGKDGGREDEDGYEVDSYRSPVTGARIISGLIPCNSIPEEILSDHPDRFRAMIVESSNPIHSLADSKKFREALEALELTVVIDVAMTETARLADYVLPATSQYEKWEATFFSFEFPENFFHLRRPILAPLPGTLGEPEIHARLVEALGVFEPGELAPLTEAAEAGRPQFAAAFFQALKTNPKIRPYFSYVLYRALGPTLPDGAAATAALWGTAHLYARSNRGSAARAGFDGEGLEPGEKLFEALLASNTGVVFSVDDYDVTKSRVRLPDNRVNLNIAEMLDELAGLAALDAPETTSDFPLVLAAGERRSFTANTVVRNPAWMKSNNPTALTVSPADAGSLGIRDGATARLVTARDAVEVLVTVDERMPAGSISLPNGLGLSYPDSAGRERVTGVAPNELTALEDRDAIAGTPWHKFVPARLEAIG